MKKKVLLVLGLVAILCCTGCSTVWSEMKEEGANLIEQGQELHESLADEANEMNSQVFDWMSGN